MAVNNTWAIIAGLNNGVTDMWKFGLQQDRFARQEERQARLDARAEESHKLLLKNYQLNLDQAERNNRKQVKQDVIEQAVDEHNSTFGKPTQQYGVAQGNGSYATTNSEGNAQDVATFMADGSAAPDAPKAEPVSVVNGLAGNSKYFTGLNGATDAAKAAKENPSLSGYYRQKALYDKLAAMPGGQDMADKVLARAKDLQREGAFDAWRRLQSGDKEGAIKAFDSNGIERFPEGHDLVKIAGKDGLRDVWQLQGPGGKVAVPDLERHMQGYMFNAADAYKNGLELVNNDFNRGQAIKTGERADRQLQATIAQHKAALGLQSQRLQMARENHEVAMRDARIPAAVKIQLLQLNDSIKIIDTQMAHAMVNNKLGEEYNPNSPGIKALTEQRSDLITQYGKALTLIPPAPAVAAGRAAAPPKAGFAPPSLDALRQSAKTVPNPMN